MSMTKNHTQLAKISFEGFSDITTDVSFLVCLNEPHYTTVVGTTLAGNLRTVWVSILIY